METRYQLRQGPIGARPSRVTGLGGLISVHLCGYTARAGPV